jgi:hypothetical protein
MPYNLAAAKFVVTRLNLVFFLLALETFIWNRNDFYWVTYVTLAAVGSILRGTEY